METETNKTLTKSQAATPNEDAMFPLTYQNAISHFGEFCTKFLDPQLLVLFNSLIDWFSFYEISGNFGKENAANHLFFIKSQMESFRSHLSTMTNLKLFDYCIPKEEIYVFKEPYRGENGIKNLLSRIFFDLLLMNALIEKNILIIEELITFQNEEFEEIQPKIWEILKNLDKFKLLRDFSEFLRKKTDKDRSTVLECAFTFIFDKSSLGNSVLVLYSLITLLESEEDFEENMDICLECYND